MPQYRVTFDRIGRGRAVGNVLEVEAEEPRELAEHVFRYAGDFLASGAFTVQVADDGTGTIDGGRFGSFSWEVA